MHGTVCLLRAGQPRRAGAAAKSGRLVGQFSWGTGDPIVVKGLYRVITIALYNPLTTTAIQKLLEMIGRVPFMSFVFVRDRSRLGHKPDCRLGWLSEYVRKSMYAWHSVSVACRPAETRRRRGEIGSTRRSILVGHRRPNRRQRVIQSHYNCIV